MEFINKIKYSTINILENFLVFFSSSKKYYILNFFFFFQNFCLIYDKKKKIFFKQFFYSSYDLITIRNIFYKNEYNLFRLSYFEDRATRAIIKNNKKKLIIDCGANIGSSSSFFYNEYKNSTIVSVEPSPHNFSLLKKNCPENEIIKMNRAVTSRNIFYKVNSSVKDNRAFTISKVSKNTKFKSITISEILNNYPKKNYFRFIIKIDIEGFEKDLFSQNYEWIDDFSIIIIELHDWMIKRNSISNNFIQALASTMKLKKKRDLILNGETLISIKN
jgi:FkbM family methyltransferase